MYSLKTILQRLLSGRGKKAGRRDKKRSFLPAVEFLEDRWAPSASTLPSPAPAAGVLTGQVSNGGQAVTGVTITLTGTTDAGQAVNVSTHTDSSGDYKFLQVQPGSYSLTRGSTDVYTGGDGTFGNLGGKNGTYSISTIAVQAGQVGTDYNFSVDAFTAKAFTLQDFLSISPDSLLSSVLPAGAGQTSADGSVQPSSGASFSNGTTTVASITGTVQNTSNSDAGMANVQLALTGIDITGNAVFQTTTTDGSGNYTFNLSEPGTYTIQILGRVSGFKAGQPLIPTGATSAGGLGFLDSEIYNIVVPSGSTTTYSGYDFEMIAVPQPAATTPDPVVTAELANDTAAGSGTVSDNVTSDPSIQGRVTVGSNNSPIVSLSASVNGSAMVNVTGSLNGGDFYLNEALLAQIKGNSNGILADGTYTVKLQAVDKAGDIGTISVTFTLQTATPTVPTLTVDPTTLGSLGPIVNTIGGVILTNNTINATSGSVTLDASVPSGDTVQLFQGTSLTPLVPASDDGNGNLTYSVVLSSGVNNFVARAEDSAGNMSQLSTFVVLNQAPTATTSSATNTTVAAGTTSSILNLADGFTDGNNGSTIVLLQTSRGPVYVQMFDTATPQTVANFLAYINSGAWNNAVLNRLVPDFVLQGGNYTLASDPTALKQVTTSSITFATPDGFTNGQEVVYNANGTPIGGLADGHTYFVIVINSTTIELATSLANAQAQQAVALTSAGGSGQTFTALTTGKAVTFSSTAVTPNPTTNPTVTVTPQNETVSVSETSGVITITSNGSLVTVTGGNAENGLLGTPTTTGANVVGSTAAGLTINASNDTLNLSVNGHAFTITIPHMAPYASADALAAAVQTAINTSLLNFFGSASGILSITSSSNLVSITGGDGETTMFGSPTVSGATLTGSKAPTTLAINSTNDTLKLSFNGTPFTVSIPDMTYASASALGTAIQTAINAGLAALDNQITFSSPTSFTTGEEVVYHNGGGTSIGGLTDGQTYFVISVNSQAIKLATTLTNAQAGTAITLGTATGGTGQSFTPVSTTKTVTFNASAVALNNSTINSEQSLTTNTTNQDFAGTLSMALQSGATAGSYNTNSASDQFFFNLTNDSTNSANNLDPNFTVFAKVLSGSDQRVLNTLASVPTFDESSYKPDLTNIPLKGYNGTSFPSDATASNFELIESATIVSQPDVLTYSVTNVSDPSGVLNTTGGQPAVNNNGTLTLNYNSGVSGIVTITVKATDLAGVSVTQTFTVTVGQVNTTTTSPTTATQAFSTSANTVTLVGNVSSSGGTVNTGTFTFTVPGIGSVTSGTVTAGTASATLTIPAGETPQTLTVTTSYSGGGAFQASSNTTGTLVITTAATTTSPTNAAAAANDSSSQTLTLTGNVSSTAGPINSGTFTFIVGNLGSVTSGTITNGQASATFVLPANTTAQSITITTDYNGSTDFATSSDNTGTLTVT